ncbi:hypothetical protein B808_271 [Fructilactobacillus florum 8D]|uniref:Uncharacterized protein n=1 Tax=Fructilactobacillus florum 8D TaxID=1221538 RepID=W9EFF6_9LACO|nr:hypothetical protein B807_647 [Fructilactobacillus florum 2F]ETO40812.1 hypothetical protein B808_271 [Fructilactobacillus florum 8D]
MAVYKTISKYNLKASEKNALLAKEAEELNKLARFKGNSNRQRTGFSFP